MRIPRAWLLPGDVLRGLLDTCDLSSFVAMVWAVEERRNLCVPSTNLVRVVDQFDLVYGIVYFCVLVSLLLLLQCYHAVVLGLPNPLVWCGTSAAPVGLGSCLWFHYLRPQPMWLWGRSLSIPSGYVVRNVPPSKMLCGAVCAHCLNCRVVVVFVVSPVFGVGRVRGFA